MPTGESAVLWSLTMAISSILVAVGCAIGCWRVASRSTRQLRSLRKQVLTGISESALAKLAAEQAEFASTLQKLTTTMKRLSSRSGMQERRAQEALDLDAPPPVEAGKQALRDYVKRKGLRLTSVPAIVDKVTHPEG